MARVHALRPSRCLVVLALILLGVQAAPGTLSIALAKPAVTAQHAQEPSYSEFYRTTVALLLTTPLPSVASAEGGQPASDPVITDVLVTNRRDVALSVTWRTDVASDGWVEYGPTPGLGLPAYDDRGQGTMATLHHVTLSSLTPETTYYFRVHSGNTVVGQGVQPFQVTTRPTTPPGTPVTAYGQVQYGTGTPAAGSLLVARLIDGSGTSEPLSALVDGYGYWVLSLTDVDCASANLQLRANSPAGEVVELTHPACQCQPAPVIQFGATPATRSIYLPAISREL